MELANYIIGYGGAVIITGFWAHLAVEWFL